MSMPDEFELSRLSEEAARLLAGLSDANDSSNSRSTLENSKVNDITTQTVGPKSDERRNQDDIDSDIKRSFFAAAVSELRRRKALKPEDPPPSLELSRQSKSSFVLCNSQNKVIGRVPLSLLHPRIKQIPIESHNIQSSAPLHSSILTYQRTGDSIASRDEAFLPLDSELTPQEHSMFILEYNQKKKSVTTGVMLALFLGGLGAHKFWLGSVATGIIYLIFCWTFIPGIVAFFDACMMPFTVQRFNAAVAEAAYRKIMTLR